MNIHEATARKKETKKQNKQNQNQNQKQQRKISTTSEKASMFNNHLHR